MRMPVMAVWVSLAGSLGAPHALAAPAGADGSVDRTALTQLACRAGQAYASRDLETLDALTAEDYEQTDVRGGVLKREEWREFVRNRPTSISVACDSIEVRFYSGVAVVTGGWTYTQKAASGDIVRRSRWTSVWTKEPGGWKRHAFQNTYVNPNANHCDSPPWP